MKINKVPVLKHDELFGEAEKRLGWSWNKCCNIFHGEEVISSPEYPNYRDMDLENEDYYEEQAKQGNEVGMAYKLIHDLMKENNIEELKIITD